MTKKRLGRTQKAMALVPLALLSTAWTANLAGVSGTATASASEERTVLPDGTTVPSEALDDPASLTVPGLGGLGLGLSEESGDKIVQSASTNGIPAAALSAYQRAATVINKADKGCQIPWELVAAIGRIESDHGRYGNNTLGKDGLSTPGIYGVALNGKQDTQAIADTDAGRYDRDAKWDRAVGPMQFIPQTWSVVGVDADGDGKRDPQDIDDAALAAAVYLCSGNDDLSTTAGQRASVFRYNHSQRYVDLVLQVMRAYQDGNFTAVPNRTTSAATFTPDYTYPDSPDLGPTLGKNDRNQGGDSGSTQTVGDGGSTGTDDQSGSDDGGNGGSNDGGNNNGGGNDGGNNGGGDDGGSKDPVETVKEKTKDTVDKTVETVDKTLATTRCLAEVGLTNLSQLDLLGLLKKSEYDACMKKYGY